MRKLFLIPLLLTALVAWADEASVARRLDDFGKSRGREQVNLANALMDEFRKADLSDEIGHFRPDAHPDSVRMQVWYWAAEYFYAEQDFQQSIAYGEKALPLTRGTSWEADCLSIVSLAYFRLSDYEQAVRYAKECYKLDERTGDPDIMSSSLNTLAGIYIGANRPQEAEQYILKAIQLAKQVDNPARMAVLQGMASEVYHQMRNDQEALGYARRACEIEEQRGDLYKLAVRRTQLASVNLGLHQYTEAEATLREAIYVFRQVGDRHSLGIALNKLGQSVLCQERQAEAVPYYREAEQLFVEMGDLANEMHAQRGLYESYWKLNPDSAKIALDRFDLLKDSLYSNATAESMARYNAEFGTDWLHKENEQLRSRTRVYIIIGILLCLLLVVGVWGWMRRRMHLREAALQAIIDGLRQEKTAERTAEVQPSASRSVGISEEERRFLDRLVGIVRNHLIQRERITVESLASDMCMSRSNLNRQVKSLTGATTQQYLMRIRMEQARLLLETRTDLSITDVADLCGFEELSTFSRAFSSTFGISPTQYRKQ